MGGQVGIVVVSHSRALAEAALALALDMVAQDPPPIALAAGTDDGGFGTDAVRVAAAIEEVDAGAGVVVLTDLGSAVLSAEMALEFLPDPDLPVKIVPAPFVEGLLAAVVRAAGGANLAEVAAEAAGALSGKIDQLGAENDSASLEAATEPVAAKVSREVRIVNPAGLHARPAGVVAGAAAQFDAEVRIALPGKAAVPAVSALGLAGLGTRAGDTVTLSASGPDAAAVVAALAELIESGFGEAESAQPMTGAKPRGARVTATGTPIGVSPGRVLGPVLRMADPLPTPDLTRRIPEDERERAVAQLTAAVEHVAAGLRERASRATGEVAAVLEATAMLASDPLVLESATAAVREKGLTAEAATVESFDAVASHFQTIGGLQAERVTDLTDIRNRIVATLMGAKLPGIPQSERPFVLVADDLAPADTAELDPATCLAIVSAEGGPTSHTAILARSLEIPAVVAAPIARELHDGDVVLVDGTSGEIVRDPAPELAATARTTPLRLTEHAPFAGLGATADGAHVSILANVGGPQDVAAAVERGAEGVGLFRTEFCFLGRSEAPGRDEQVAAYRRVLEGFPGQRVVIRTLDAGSDKPLPFLTPGHEENPALGVRGYRTAAQHPDVLQLQLEAIAEAATAVPGSEPWVMAPMIATVTEAEAFASAGRAAGHTRVGVMVETPSAALMAEELFAHVDFVSLGTNDLTQYTMAADRLSGALAEFGDLWQPAVLRLIETCVAGSNGKPVGVCGEAAADPLLARVLVGIGVTSLSMSARAVPVVGEAVASGTLDRYEEAAAAALAAATAAEARAAAATVLNVRE